MAERKARRDLERMLVDETAEPRALPLSLLEDITGDFSHAHEIGRGGFAVVYKGILSGDMAVAVKRLTNDLMDEMGFHREVECLMRVKHKNVVRFLGYCANRQGTMETYGNKLVMADVHQRLLCFEYIPQGSLDKYIIDAHREWGTCYRIIKGICEGLQYLHENNIIHLDLKPANILLGNNMVPKITDFGLSRYFDENQSRHITKTILGTLGYLPPEYIDHGIISKEFDIFSLGVIIAKLMAGSEVYFKIDDMGEKGFVKHVHDNWRKRLGATLAARPLEAYCEQVRICIQIAVKCMNRKRQERPTIQSIVSDLIKTEIMIGNVGLETEQFHDEDPVLPEGGIQTRTPVQTKGRKIPMPLRTASASATMVSGYRQSEAVGACTESLGSESGFVGEEHGAKDRAAQRDWVWRRERQQGERCLPPAMSRSAEPFMRAERRGGRLILTQVVRPVERPREVFRASRAGGRRLLEVRRNGRHDGEI